MKTEKEKEKKLINVVIVDDDDSYRESLKKILENDKRIRIFGEYANGEDFIHSLDSPFIPDVCLMDIVLKNLSGIESIKKVKKKYPNIYFIIMTAYPEAKSFAEVRQIDVDYVEKGTRIESLINKIITSANPSKAKTNSRIISVKNNIDLNFKYLELIDSMEKVTEKLKTLSKLQLKVIKLRKKRKSIKQIANILNISVGTVHTHITRAMKKLGLPNLLDYIID